MKAVKSGVGTPYSVAASLIFYGAWIGYLYRHEDLSTGSRGRPLARGRGRRARA